MTGYNSCFFCLGISALRLSEKDYHRTTFELTVSVAETLSGINKDMIFCYISGAGTDSSGNGKMMWARVKGKTENALLSMPFKKAYMFRPGFIQPMKGIKSKTKSYNVLYSIFKPFYFILKHFDSFVINTQIVGKAMILTSLIGFEKNILENKDINKIVRENEELQR